MPSTSQTALNPPTLDPLNNLTSENADVKLNSDELCQAAVKGDVEFVRKCIDNNTPPHYYFTLFESKVIREHTAGNFLHIAIQHNQLKFIEQVIELLPPKVIRQLLLQLRSPRSGLLNNPLHYAAALGNIKAVKLILRFCESHPSLLQKDDEKPWLQRDFDGFSPCQTAIAASREDCALEILKMDFQKLSNMVTKNGNGLLNAAVRKGFEEVALQILESPSFTCSGIENLTPLHNLPYCSGGQESQDICRLLIQKVPSLVTTKSDTGHTILHYWAQEGNVWPFECILKCKDLYPHDLNRVIVDLMSATCTPLGRNAFHILAEVAPDEEDAVKIAKILIKGFRDVVATQQVDHLDFPWLAINRGGVTPLKLSLKRKYNKLARYILLEESDASMEYQSDNLLFAIKHGCQEVAEMILKSVVKEKWADLKDDQQFNSLHYAPSCNVEFVQLLIDGNPKLIEGMSTYGLTILQTWIIEGKVWPFRYILEKAEFVTYCKQKPGLFMTKDSSGCTVFHYAAFYYNEITTNEIVQLLADGYKKLYSSWNMIQLVHLPWLLTDCYHDQPLHVAIKGQHEALAIQILSLHEDDDYHRILDLDKLKCKTLFLAMEYKCYQVAKKVLDGLNKQRWTPYLENSSNRLNIMHFLHNCTVDGEFGKWLVKTAPEFITKQDTSGITPLDKASEAGVDWLVSAMLSTNPTSIFHAAPLAWVNACKNGHASIVRTFIDCHPRSFKDHCVENNISPLHHMKLPNIKSYEEFLKQPYMMDLINVQDSEGATPLHAAIRTDDIHLTEALLKISDTSYEIKDDNNVTARSLLQKKYKEDKSWKKMCQSIGFHPNIRINYLKRKTNLLDVRSTLSVVAALLVTITFTAGFTLPGGLNQDTGEAMLARKAAFVVFMISDTTALCCSILVLICLIWSIVIDSSRSMFLIDQSMNLLMISLFFTMIAFMCGVFMVVSQKSMWVAILVIVMCSLLATAIIGTMLYQLVKSVIHKAKNNGPAGSPV